MTVSPQTRDQIIARHATNPPVVTEVGTVDSEQMRDLLERTTRESVERQCNERRDAILGAGWDLDEFKAELFRRQFPKLLAQAGL